MLRELMDRLRRSLPGRSGRVRRELEEEIRTHLELRTRELTESGLSPEEARREAERRFGDLAAARRRLEASAQRGERRMRLGHRLDSLRQDVRVAARRIVATPGFSALSILTFALGVALTTTMYAAVDVAILRPLPYPEPDDLVALWSVAEEGNEFPWVSSTNWLDWREQNRSLATTALYMSSPVSVAAGEETARVPGASVGGAFFETLQMPFLVGRGFSEAEADERAPVAVVSESFWRRFLNGDPELGDVTIDGASRRVVGVVSDRVALPDRARVWTPAIYQRQSGAARNNINWLTLARLAPGVTRTEARTDLDRIAAGIREQAPEAAYSWGVGVVPLNEVVTGDAEGPLLLLIGAVAAVLLVACANLAGQAYARSLGNVEGAAVRRALGATRGRILQHQMVEHLLLALLGGAVGLAATWLVGGWLATVEIPLPRAEAIRVDPRVAGFALGVSLLSGLLAGSLPAWRLARAAPREAMGGGRGAAGQARPRAARLLVAAEITLSVLLLIGGGLMIRGYGDFLDRDVGFEPEGIFAADVALHGAEYTEPEARFALWEGLLEELRSFRGIQSAAIASEIPGADRSGYGWIEIVGRPDLRESAATYRVVGEDYFETLGLPLLAGRDFAAEDTADSPRVAVVNRAFADAYWPDDNPIGTSFRSVSMERDAAPTEIIGVVGNLDTGTGIERRPATYVLYRQTPNWSWIMYVTARVRGDDPLALASVFRQRLNELDPDLATEIGTVSGHLGEVVARDRLVMSLLNGFALLALALAAIGVHGLLSFSVARRTRELAVRSALGADRNRILGMVIGDAVRMAIVAAALGAIGAWWLSGYLDTEVVGIQTSDPVTFGVVIVTMLAVTVGAAGLPAWRAVRMDPNAALRTD